MQSAGGQKLKRMNKIKKYKPIFAQSRKRSQRKTATSFFGKDLSFLCALCGFARDAVRKKAGFTLLEIMVALAIIGSLLVTVLYSLNYHLGIAEKHEFITVATMLAKNKMSDMEQIPSAGKGTFPDPYSAYNYETGVKDSSYPGLSEMWVTVSKDKENVKLTELRQNTTQ